MKNKSEILKNNANVLLISDIECEYQCLKDYGFKNVDYFKSMIRADKYFKNHPETLNKYHIILIGNQNAIQRGLGCPLDLEEQLRNIKDALKMSIYNYNYIDYLEIVAYFKGSQICSIGDTKEKAYSGLFDKLVDIAIMNNITDKIPLKQVEFKPIEDYINPNRIPLPTKKSDLKILYLDAIRVNQFARDIANNLGLNIKFKEDSNYGLERYVNFCLGDYDIIIVSKMYSSNILNMNIECTEQGKDSGRDLTLLVTYDEDSIWHFDEDNICYSKGFGDKVTLRYIFGGMLADNQEFESKEFRVLRQSTLLERFYTYDQSMKNDMQAIIEEAVNMYNDYLLKIGKLPLADFDLKSASQYDQEFEEVIQKEKQRQEEALKSIKIFNDFKYQIENYVRFRKQGLIASNIDGLKITETDKEICVQNIFNGRVLCVITFLKEYKQDNLRTFTIQTISNKGNLGKTELVGLYTKKFEGVAGLPKRVDEQQMNALIATYKKVDKIIKPMVTDAWKKYSEQIGKKRTKKK